MCRGWLSQRGLRLFFLRLVGEITSFVGSELACTSLVLSRVNLLLEGDFGGRLLSGIILGDFG